MAQDFAKHRTTGKKPAPRKKSGGASSRNSPQNSHWSWFLTGMISGLFIAFIAYLGVVRPGIINQVNTVATDSLAATGSDEESTNQARFDFYEYFPAAEVQVDVVPVEVTSQNSVTDEVQYLLQAGSFQSRSDAESRRAEILLLNLDASVVPGIVSGKTWHRVQVGPFTGKRTTETARNTLASNNIDSIPLLMK